MAKRDSTLQKTQADANDDAAPVATSIPGEQRGKPRDVDDEPEPVARTYRGVKVRAILDGYYGDKMRRVGDVFVIDGTPGKKKGQPAAFSEKWMERVDATTPEKISTNNDVIRRQHDEIVSGNATGDADPLGD